MPRISLAVLIAALCVAPAGAQELERPDDWKVRFDNPDASEADLEMFVDMPPGWHITTGPAGIFWAPDHTASGDFRLEMEVFLFDPQGRREAFGLFVGGRDLEGAGQEYTYFLLRDGGQFIIKRREGSQAPTIVPWTGDDSVNAYADRGDEASVKNVLAVEAKSDRVTFLVNGTEVTRMPRSEVPVDGIYGIRMNHALNVHVSRLELTPLE